jgi:PAS domain S-box-containing protein
MTAADIFRTVADYTYDWESWIGPDGRPIWINRAVERMTGHSVEACLAMPDYPMPLIHADDRANLAAHFALAAQEQSANDVAFRIQRTDGQSVWAAVSYQAMPRERGVPAGFRTSVRDISERVRAEQETQRARAEAERANAAKSKFLAAASHDLRQPLQAIAMFTAALQATVETERGRTIIASIGECLTSVNELLDGLLDVSRLDAGVLMPQIRAFPLIDLIERIEHEYAPLAAAKNLRLRAIATSATVMSDPSLLARVLDNLVANAVRYTDRGGVVIGARRRGATIRIVVADSGIGIAADQQRAIFDDFYQVGNPNHDRPLGLGLGLAIVERIAALLGHRVAMRSRLGHGSVFTVDVPAARPIVEETAGDNAPERTDEPDLGATFAAVLDDEPLPLLAIATLLDRWNVRTVTAATIEELEEAIAGTGRRPDIVILDYRLRDGRTGADALARLRAAHGADLPSLIVTGDTEPARLRAARAAGAILLHKPVTGPVLRAALVEALGRGADAKSAIRSRSPADR